MKSLIYDENQIRRFANLIQSKENVHVISLFSRSKYMSNEQKEDFRNTKLATRYSYNKDEDSFLKIVKKIEYDYYIEKVPEDSVVIYCTTNPRDIHLAQKKYLIEVVNNLFDETSSVPLHNRLESCLMSSKGPTNIITIDIDSKEDLPEVWVEMKQLKIEPVALIETRGGYHLLLPKCNSLQTICKKFSTKHTIGDVMCPIPGTIQGGFRVKFIDNLA